MADPITVGMLVAGAMLHLARGDFTWESSPSTGNCTRSGKEQNRGRHAINVVTVLTRPFFGRMSCSAPFAIRSTARYRRSSWGKRNDYERHRSQAVYDPRPPEFELELLRSGVR
jgi:hypothetical protein